MKITVKTVESATAEFEVTEEVGRWHKMAAVEGGTELMPFSLFSPSQMTVEDLKVEISKKMVSNVIPNACLNGLTDNYYILLQSTPPLKQRLLYQGNLLRVSKNKLSDYSKWKLCMTYTYTAVLATYSK